MKKIYFTITGTNHRYGMKFFEPKQEVRLVKEPDNEFDKEAIKVEMEGLGHRIGDTAKGIVKYVLPQGILCELVLESKDEKKEGGQV